MRERAKVSSETAGGEQRRLGQLTRLHTRGQSLQLFWLQPRECTCDILMTQCTERLFDNFRKQDLPLPLPLQCNTLLSTKHLLLKYPSWQMGDFFFFFGGLGRVILEEGYLMLTGNLTDKTEPPIMG